jgi:Domain of unknown function (DUF4132)
MAPLRRLGGSGRKPDFDWASHQRRAGDLVAEAQSVYREGRDDGWTRRQGWVTRMRQLSPEARASLLLLLTRQAVADSHHTGQGTAWALGEIDPRQCAVSDENAACALRTMARLADHYWTVAVAAKACAMAAQAQPGTSAELGLAIEEALASITARANIAAADRARLRRGLLVLAAREKRLDEAIDTALIAADDAWAAAVLPELAGWQETVAGSAESVNALLSHLIAASGSKPSKAWLARAQGLVRGAGAGRLVRLLVEALATAGVSKASRYGMTYRTVVSDSNADIARAAGWAASLIDEPWVVPALRAAASQGITVGAGNTATLKPANACIYSLGVIASADAIAALQYLHHTTRHNGFRKQISAALASAAQRSGLTPSQLAERVVPAAGLGAGSGRLMVLAHGVTARVRITADCRLVTEWDHGGRWLPRAPTGVDPKQYPPLRAAAKEVKDALAADRARLESLLAGDRRWDAADWRDLYLAHPVTGPAARRLLWTIEDPAGTVTGLPGGDGKLSTLDGVRDIGPTATVRLWHPARAATAQVRAWRDRLVRDEQVQPFKQAFREVYLLTPAERETRLYSNRFAAHILHYQQAYALMKARAWASNYLGPHDGGHDGAARRDFADAGLTAVFTHYPVDAGPADGRVQLCSTDQVLFHQTGDRARQPVPLHDVPDLVFSEAMRDVDLFVGVASIALDPNWTDRGDAAHLDYWRAFSFGELSETAQVRRDALARIVPQLAIASRLELGERFLRVQGRLNAYKIHLGSANIQIEPDDRYLCIVPGGNGLAPKVMLPFEGDQVLSLILSKAVLLAADDKITDPTIRRQLPHRA